MSAELVPAAFRAQYDAFPAFVREAIDRKLPAAKRHCDSLLANSNPGDRFLRPGVELPVPLDTEAAAFVYDIAFSTWLPEANEAEYNRLGRALFSGGTQTS